jgi:hypothetical protein
MGERNVIYQIPYSNYAKYFIPSNDKRAARKTLNKKPYQRTSIICRISIASCTFIALMVANNHHKSTIHRGE